MSENSRPEAPLAARMRPRSLDDYVGQEHVLAPGKPLRLAVESGSVHSMLLWGPPGVGKTSLARMIAECTDAHFQALSAVFSGVKDIRAAMDEARRVREERNCQSILFVDEVHRFNKAQQDAFLPFIEDGTVVFIGATTENPSFELNSALLSRARVYRLRPLDADAITRMMRRALVNDAVLCEQGVSVSDEALQRIATASDGDGRRAMNLLEIAIDLAANGCVDDQVLTEVLQGDPRRFDKGGDIFYDQISALHKAVRGSSPDAALYWMMRMLDGGCDPLYVARRVVRMAIEDIGVADPRALPTALAAWDTQTRLGSPEGELAIAQAVVYLACAPKSNALYTAFNSVKKSISSQPSYEVPTHLRNAPTAMLKGMGHGEDYRYAHDEPGAYAAGEAYLPEQIRDLRWYEPTERGLEKQIRDKLNRLRELDAQSPRQRYEGHQR